MRMLLVFAPVIMLGAAWLLGYARLTRAFVTYVAMLFVGVLLIATSGFSVVEPSFGRFVLGVTCFVFAIPVSVLVGLTGRNDPAPITVAADVYDGLTAEQREKFRKGLSVGARFAARHFSRHLADRGHARSAEALREGARFI